MLNIEWQSKLTLNRTGDLCVILSHVPGKIEEIVTKVLLSTRITESIRVLIRATSHLRESKLIRVENQQASFENLC